MSNPLKTKTERPAPADVIETRVAASFQIAIILDAQLKREKITAERDSAIAKISQGYNKDIDDHTVEIETGILRLKEWAEAHPSEFGNAQSIVIDGHTLGFRKNPYEAKPKKSWKDFITTIETLLPSKPDLSQYIRQKIEPNKEALINDRENTDLLKTLGVKVTQGVTFYLKPARVGQEKPEISLAK